MERGATEFDNDRETVQGDEREDGHRTQDARYGITAQREENRIARPHHALYIP